MEAFSVFKISMQYRADEKNFEKHNFYETMVKLLGAKKDIDN
jgi:hypothetical protein